MGHRNHPEMTQIVIQRMQTSYSSEKCYIFCCVTSKHVVVTSKAIFITDIGFSTASSIICSVQHVQLLCSLLLSSVTGSL